MLKTQMIQTMLEEKDYEINFRWFDTELSRGSFFIFSYVISFILLLLLFYDHVSFSFFVFVFYFIISYHMLSENMLKRTT